MQQATSLAPQRSPGDITERKRAAEQRDLLTKEMGHQVKNCFAIFRSLVTLSARSANTTEEMAEELAARLAALAALTT